MVKSHVISRIILKLDTLVRFISYLCIFVWFLGIKKWTTLYLEALYSVQCGSKTQRPEYQIHWKTEQFHFQIPDHYLNTKYTTWTSEKKHVQFLKLHSTSKYWRLLPKIIHHSSHNQNYRLFSLFFRSLVT